MKCLYVSFPFFAPLGANKRIFTSKFLVLETTIQRKNTLLLEFCNTKHVVKECSDIVQKKMNICELLAVL